MPEISLAEAIKDLLRDDVLVPELDTATGWRRIKHFPELTRKPELTRGPDRAAQPKPRPGFCSVTTPPVRTAAISPPLSDPG